MLTGFNACGPARSEELFDTTEGYRNEFQDQPEPTA
jgi:hypothetical protein